ncbi:MAG TPA: S46 family peptidase, partial [Sphingomicrobium sp.]
MRFSMTLLGGTFERATGADRFDLPRRFVAARSGIDPNTVYDFVTTNEIIGGN